MKARTTLWISIVIFVTSAASVLAEPAPPKLSAYSAVLIDSVSGTVLFEKRSHARRPPASTTKMMTAILALENTNLEDTVCASEGVCQTPFSSLHLKPGERLTMHHLLHGLLLRSANDAASCVAENIAGSQSEFAKMMNEKAKEIGAKHTHFVNPHGLYNPKHYSTAYDLALIARYATRFPVFNEIVRTKAFKLDRSINTKDIALRNTANFLWKYEGADGIKTGYTKEAGHCFVGSATRNNWRLISVVMKSPQCGEDTKALLNFGFKYFRPVVFARYGQVADTVQVHGGTVGTVNAIMTRDLGLVLRKNRVSETKTEIDLRREISAPITRGEKLGTLTAYVDGREYGTVDIVAAETVERTLGATIWHYVRGALIISAIVLIGFIAYGTAVAKTVSRRRRRIPQRGRRTDNFRPSRYRRPDSYSTRYEGRSGKSQYHR